MSELKANKIGDLCFDFKMGKDVGIDFYLKSEADKVIVEMNEQIEVLKHQACKMDCMTVKLYNEACDDLIHQKYKRCLDMVAYCDLKMSYWAIREIHEGDTGKFDLYSKWHERWLELAEKFKEAE